VNFVLEVGKKIKKFWDWEHDPVLVFKTGKKNLKTCG
jgi:hypothetical protein